MTRVDLYRDNQPLVTSLPLLSANVQDDYTADIRRRCDVTLAGTSEVMELLPDRPENEGGLWPVGNEIRIRSGIEYNDGTEELVPMGVFRIANPAIRIDSEGERTVAIKGYDRSRAISRNKFIEPWNIPASATDMAVEIKNLIQDRLPMLTDEDFILMTSFFRPPRMTFLRDNDPWKDAAVKMAASMGAEVFFDGLGRLVVQPIPDPLEDPISFDYIADQEATILDLDRTLDDEQGFNGAIMSSQSSDNNKVFEGQYWDKDPHSPTYYDPLFPEKSIYGAVPYIGTSEFITSQAQADAAAKGEFNARTGIIEVIDFSAICNPAHTSGDTVKIQEDTSNTDDVNVLHAITFNLTEGTMTAQTRRRVIGEAA